MGTQANGFNAEKPTDESLIAATQLISSLSDGLLKGNAQLSRKCVDDKLKLCQHK
jgi:hypothetical protein